MIIPLHRNNDSKKSADYRHVTFSLTVIITFLYNKQKTQMACASSDVWEMIRTEQWPVRLFLFHIILNIFKIEALKVSLFFQSFCCIFTSLVLVKRCRLSVETSNNGLIVFYGEKNSYTVTI